MMRVEKLPMVWVGVQRAGRTNARIDGSVVSRTEPSHEDTESVLSARHKVQMVSCLTPLTQYTALVRVFDDGRPKFRIQTNCRMSVASETVGVGQCKPEPRQASPTQLPEPPPQERC